MRARQKVSRTGIELIKSFEGLRQTATRLPDGRWSLGYGHTFSAREGARVSEDDAEALLRFDLLPIVEALNTLIQVPLEQHQFDALVSFCFNIGIDNFKTSKVLKRLNEGQMDEAAQAMDAWRSAEFNGQVYVLEPLIRRRAAEKDLFLGTQGAGAQAAPVTPASEINTPESNTPEPVPLTGAADLEQARIEQERLEMERLAQEAAAKAEAERAEQARLEQARLEQARLEQEAREAAERLAQEDAAKAEAARVEAERLEHEREEARRAEAEARQLEAQRFEAERAEAQRLEDEKAAEAQAVAEQTRKAEAQAALMRLYSPYAGALGRPLLTPFRGDAPILAVPDLAPSASEAPLAAPEPSARPAGAETAPLSEAETEIPEAASPISSAPVLQTAATLPPPVVTALNPFSGSHADAQVAQETEQPSSAADTFQDSLNWRQHLQRPLPADYVAPEAADPAESHAQPDVEPMIEAVADTMTMTTAATHYDEASYADDGWTLADGRVAMSSEHAHNDHPNWWTMIVSTFWWIFISGIGLACLGVAAGAYYKSKDMSVIRNGVFGDYMAWSFGMAIVGMLCVLLSVWLIMRRLGGLKD